MSLDSLFSLRNSYALITGAAGLLGMKHAEAILAAGGRVVMTDLNAKDVQKAAESLSAKHSDAVLSYAMDVTREESIRQVFDALKAQDIFVDILINNAARNPAVGSQPGVKFSSRLENLDVKSLDLDVSVGLTGAILCAKVFGAEMAARKRGVVINVASDLGVIAPDQRLYRRPGLAPNEQDVKPVSYSVVKHGLIGLTKYLATYWAEDRVRCNCISPGGVFNGQNQEFVEKLCKLIPLGRMANVDEYQGAIVFLASPASSYLNGANLVVDGGRSVW